MKKRCDCGSGECWNCFLGMLDRLFVRDSDYRHCKCGSSHCAICNYYKQRSSKNEIPS